jgi:cell wall-associated NlpC family hydrolase
MRWVAAAGAGVLAVPVLAAGAAFGALGGLGGGGSMLPASRAALAAVPVRMLRLDGAAAATCPGLPWQLLAAIGQVETDSGRDANQVSSAGAVGPMQFLPATFTRYAYPVPPGGARPASPWNATDAVYAAARLLCANGGRGGRDLPAAVFAYNHSTGYVREVLALAASYTAAPPAGSALARAVVVRYALGQLGTPYRWGGEAPGVGFDCSGLTQAAYAAAGIAIPRTSEAQWAALPHLPLADATPGDLIFADSGEFGPGPGHVAIYLGDGEVIDAPHTGAVVRIDPIGGIGPLVGAARP